MREREKKKERGRESVKDTGRDRKGERERGTDR